MKTSQFCLLIRSAYSCEFVLADPEKEIYTFKPVPDSGELEKGILYISPQASSPSASAETSFDLLVYGPGVLGELSALRDAFPRANILCVRQREGEGLSTLYGTVSDIFLMENRFTAQINRLSYISSTGLGMQAVIDEAARILEAPVVVIDSSYCVLATSNLELREDETNLAEQRRIGALTQRNLERLRRDKVFEHMRKNPDRMCYGKAPDAHHWWVNMLIYVHGVEVAEVGIMEDRRKFSDYDFELVKYLRYLISLEIQRGHSFGENYSVAHNLLTAELLEPHSVAETAIRHRTALLGWAESSFYSVLVIFPQEGKPPAPQRFFRQAEILASQASHCLPKSYWRIGEQDITFLIPHEQRYPEDLAQCHKLCELLKVNHMAAILSNPVGSLLEVHKGYEQARALYQVREFLPKDCTLHRYCDHSILHIASILYKSHALEEFYHPYVLMLRDYDRENHTYFLRTLREYLTYIDNPAAIAKRLHIHKNTLYYRMNKLKEIFPIDLNDGHVRLCLQLTMEMMRLEEGE